MTYESPKVLASYSEAELKTEAAVCMNYGGDQSRPRFFWFFHR